MPDLIPILTEVQRMLSTVAPVLVQPAIVLVTALFAGLTVRSVASRISLAPSPQRSLSAYLAQPELDSAIRFRWDDQEAMILTSLGLPTRAGLLQWGRGCKDLHPLHKDEPIELSVFLNHRQM